MTQLSLNQSTINLIDMHINFLERQFPSISTMQLDEALLMSPNIKRLTNLLQFSIPIHTYQPEILALYDAIAEQYYQRLLKSPTDQRLEIQKTSAQSTINLDHQHDHSNDQTQKKISPKKNLRCRMNYLELALFIDSFTPEMQENVSQEIIRECQRFEGWNCREIKVENITRQTPKKKEYHKSQSYQIKFAKQKVLKTTEPNQVNIIIGKNISNQVKNMKNQLIERAKNNKLLDPDQIQTILEKITGQIHFILNRITEEYFQQFLLELLPYARHQIYSFILAEKIIQKILEQHNFIKLYSKLIKSMRKVYVDFQDKKIKFKVIFIERLQQSFYNLVRRRDWSQKQESSKKHVIGFSLFLGQLIHIEILSKNIFSDCFLELISSYIHQYYQHQHDKSLYYYEIYIECIIKIIEKMGSKYDHLMENREDNINEVVDYLLQSYQRDDYHLDKVYDYIYILKEINRRLPSQRCKITFLLEDFRCSKAMRKIEDADQNNEYEVVKNVLAIDHKNESDVRKISEMVSKCDPFNIMKDYYYQFAEGNAKQVNKNIETFKLFKSRHILDAAVKVVKQNLEGLYLIQSDFPFLTEGIAKIMMLVCEQRKIEWRQLNFKSLDEDQQQFIEKIESKYYKMIVQD